MTYLGLGLTVVKRQGAVDRGNLGGGESHLKGSDVALQVAFAYQCWAPRAPEMAQTHSTFRPPMIGYT